MSHTKNVPTISHSRNIFAINFYPHYFFELKRLFSKRAAGTLFSWNKAVQPLIAAMPPNVIANAATFANRFLTVIHFIIKFPLH